MHFSDILQLAAAAWHETKSANDPEFNDCALTHRENLGAAAKAVVDHGEAFNHFDRVVQRLYRERQEAQSKAEQILEANPLLHGDQVMHIASGTPHPLTPQAFAGHAENAQMAAVREEFKGVDDSGLEAVFLDSPNVPEIDRVPEGQSTVTMSATDASAPTESPKKSTKKKK